MNKAVLTESLPMAVKQQVDQAVHHKETNSMYPNLIENNEAISTTINREKIENRRIQHLKPLQLNEDEMFSVYRLALHYANYEHNLINILG
ncbi:unnamed protein product [Didymodactylos carnosus]|uniref:Uncharacterized protein n=1 Tax=Didymodactylos carnosus TaxID=1234261 RepID=A0A815B983_9BILA|nr:unnamed protein product [Didymodactylos carnosus]CAF1267325.1 unnamed protein product [Didymodactylos carnosus]CAF3845999.1 unnamed protein product [Didymodactylos carnosus]CAF4051847.1 unnamed protein product [Didymodactylos carnosus]